MIGKLIGAAVGRRLAGRNEGARGAVIGYFAPAIARRASKPLLIAAGAGWAAKKLWDWRRARRDARTV
jgi:uncharacterized membrane protein